MLLSHKHPPQPARVRATPGPRSCLRYIQVRTSIHAFSSLALCAEVLLVLKFVAQLCGIYADAGLRAFIQGCHTPLAAHHHTATPPHKHPCQTPHFGISTLRPTACACHSAHHARASTAHTFVHHFFVYVHVCVKQVCVCVCVCERARATRTRKCV